MENIISKVLENTSRAGNDELADAHGLLSMYVKELDAMRGKIGDMLKARALKAEDHKLSVHGVTFKASVFDTKRTTLDTKAVVEALGEDWVAAHSKTTVSQTVRSTAIGSPVAMDIFKQLAA